MRIAAILTLLVVFSGRVWAYDPPLVEKYLHSGDMARGEQELNLAIDKEPENDQLRFQLGTLQVFRAVERLGQALHEYGVRSEQTWMPILRMPVPKNEHPTPITYSALRRVLELFQRDLAAAEATLAKVDDDRVTLPLRLAEIRFDLDGDGKATDKFVEILRGMMRVARFPFLEQNPEFLVVFDRGDVAWLRAYCHVLMSIIELQLSVDGQSQFDRTAHQLFDVPEKKNLAAERTDENGNPVIRFREPARLRSFRRHVVEVCKLNRETWRFIRGEQDDDHEWLPSPRQKGVLGLPVRDEMIDAWLGMIDQMEGLMKGEKVIGRELLWLFPGTRGKFSFRKFFDDPPAEINIHKLTTQGISEKYLQAEGDDVDIQAFLRVSNVFNSPLAVGYAAWFN